MSDHTAVDHKQGAGDNVKSDHLEDIHSDLILEGVVLVSGKEKHLKLNQNGLTLGTQVTSASNDKSKVLSLTWRDVMCAVKDLKPPAGHQHSSFTLHYIHHDASSKLRTQTVKIVDKDGQEDKWINAVNAQCHKVPGRPKKAFVIINPIGGARRGRQIYQKVAPLFELAGMQMTVAITEKSKHALELGEQQDFSGYDSIITVGGDGLYQEVLMGLILQIQKKAGVDYNNPDSVFSRPDIKLGIIPAGTGNGLALLCNGIVDEITAALNIIRGENQRTQIFTVHSCGKLVTVCGMIFGYGLYSDLMKRTDDLRWMGRMRYPYAFIGSLVKKPRMFNCTFEYRFADKQEKQDEDNSLGASNSQGTEWTVYTGNSGPVCGIFAMLYKQVTDGKDIFLSPYVNSVDFFVDFGCGRLEVWLALYKFIQCKNEVMPSSVCTLCDSKLL
uniref:DAGKc domain-containing protein n=1 Tax=Arion vulgaris TaxID=1028688 RepID=A0A0B7BMV7_9EUPU